MHSGRYDDVWVAVRCEASEATPTVAEASESEQSYLLCVHSNV